MESVPPGRGPSFNQMLVVALITAIIVLGALMIFEPRMRQHHDPTTNVPRTPAMPPGYNGDPN